MIKGMYYRLRNNIALRSWDKSPFCYYEYGNREAKSLTRDQFMMLLRCDGLTDLSDVDKAELDRFVAVGLIEPCSKAEAISEWQKCRFYTNRYFPHLNWAITGKCNMNCRHCFMAADQAPLMEEFIWEECLEILDDCEECGVQNITITGGEPMLHPYFMELLREISRRHLSILDINTNGTLINEDKLKEIKEMFPDLRFKISFDGIGHHDWMRNRKGAEELAVNAIKLCKQYGFRVEVQTNIHPGNIESIVPTVELAANLGVEQIRLIRTSEAPRWKEQSEYSCIDPLEYYDLMIRLTDVMLSRNIPIDVDIWQMFRFNPANHTYFYHTIVCNPECYRDTNPICKDGRGTIALASTGELSLCNQLSGTFAKNGISLGNVKRERLKKHIEGSAYLDFVTMPVSTIKEHNKKCGECSYWLYCNGGCRAIAAATTGDVLHSDPMKCMFFEKGYLEKSEELFRKYPGWKCSNRL